jgi:flagellin
MLIQASALRRFHQIDSNETQLQRSLNRLSSGSRLARTADDAAGTAIASGMKTQMMGQAQANANVQDGINYLQTADAGMQNLMDVLHRMRELSVQMANDTYTDADRQKAQMEVAQLREQLTTIPQTTQFNGLTPLVLDPATVQKLATAPGNQLDVELVIDGQSDIASQLGYLQIMATFQAVQANLQSRNLDLRMGIALSGFNNLGLPMGDSVLTDNVDGVRLIQDATTSQATMKEWLFYTIGPSQFDSNPNPPFAPILTGPGRFNTGQDNYNALVQSSGIAGSDPVAGFSESGAVVGTVNPLAPPPGPVAPGHPTTNATTTDAMARRSGVSFFQVLLTTHGSGTMATPGLPVGAGPAAAREAATAAILSTDQDLHVVVGTPGGAGGPVATGYDQIVTATNGFFFDMGATTPADFIALADQFESMIKPVPNADPTTVVYDNNVRIQAGANEGQFIDVVHPHITGRALGLEDADLSTQPGASRLIGKVDDAAKQLLAIRAKLGASQNRLESSARNLDVSQENLATSFSRIHDTDFAEESANLTKRQILMQAATSLTAQAGPLENSAWMNLRQLIGTG